MKAPAQAKTPRYRLQPTSDYAQIEEIIGNMVWKMSLPAGRVG
jgi:hypothetical protein